MEKRFSKKGYLNISFATMFAIIAGIAILILAIYGATKVINRGGEITSIEVAEEIGILLNPIETGYEVGKVTSFNLALDTRIYATCKTDETFGKQLIRVSQKSFNKWSNTDVNNDFKNKYIFAEKPVEGKEFYLFSKPFEFPFKVTDLTYLTSSEDVYCFLDAPEEIEDELSGLKQTLKNIKTSDCSDKDIVVCFGSGSCNIKVNYDYGTIKKNRKTIYFESDALMYAGIFSDVEIYECQLKRLMKKIAILGQLYRDKASFVARKDCNSAVNTELLQLINAANNFESSSGLRGFANIVEEIDYKNKNADCKLW